MSDELKNLFEHFDKIEKAGKGKVTRAAEKVVENVKQDAKPTAFNVVSKVTETFHSLEDAMLRYGRFDNVEDGDHEVEVVDNTGKSHAAKKFNHYTDKYGSRRVRHLGRHD